MSLISIIIPVFNEEDNIHSAYEAVLDVFENFRGRYDVEFVFSDNHSTDKTFEVLTEVARNDKRVKVIRYNRNYGFQRSLLTAYRYASGDAAIQLDCDLQDSPALFPEFLRLWEAGHDVVVGLRRHRHESKLLTWSRRRFYSLLNRISDDVITRDAGDFRLVDRSVMNLLKQINDQAPYVRGLISSLASNEAGIPYDREKRVHGKSKFPVRKLIGFALSGIFGHSVIPLRLAAYVGFLVSVLTFLLSIFYLTSALLFGRGWPTGFATTTILILFGISLNGIFMGVLGEYIGRIYQQVRQRPLTVMERTINISEEGNQI